MPLSHTTNFVKLAYYFAISPYSNVQPPYAAVGDVAHYHSSSFIHNHSPTSTHLWRWMGAPRVQVRKNCALTAQRAHTHITQNRDTSDTADKRDNTI